MRDNCFGRAKAVVYTIEWQKRGLPHCHMMIFLQNSDKPKTSEDYNRFLSAEFPDPVEQPILYELVKRHMVHGPCETIVSMHG